MGNGTNFPSGLSHRYGQSAGTSPGTTDEDAPLVSACQKGDIDSYEALVKKYEKKMFNIAFRITGNYEDACEVVQDAFVAAYRSIRAFRGTSRFSTWLTSILINHAKNRLRQIKTRRSREACSIDDPVTTADGEVTPDPPSREASVLDDLEKRETQKKVQDCINALQPEFREVIVLRDLQGFSYEEMCETLKVREGTVKSRLFRARDAIKECLKKIMGTL